MEPEIRKLCEAKTIGGKSCKNSPQKGKKFCWHHSLSRTTEAHWYQNSVYQCLAGIAVTILVAWYFFIKGPTLENQVKGLKQQGELTEKVDKLYQWKMTEIQAKQGSTFSNLFPFGYTLITITETKHVIPFQSGGLPVYVDWNKCKVEFSGQSILLTLPEMGFVNTGSLYGNMRVLLKRVKGSRVVVWGTDSERISVLIAKTETEGDVLVIGSGPPPVR